MWTYVTRDKRVTSIRPPPCTHSAYTKTLSDTPAHESTRIQRDMTPADNSATLLEKLSLLTRLQGEPLSAHALTAQTLRNAEGRVEEAPWWVVQAVDKKRARLNCISHILESLPYTEVERPEVILPERTRHPDYVRHPIPEAMYVPERY